MAKIDEIKVIQRNAVKDVSEKLQKEGVPDFLADLYSARGVKNIEEVTYQLRDIHPISSLKNAVEMGKILADCVENRERVLIVSDYDCDGATACSVLIRAFQGARMNFGYLVPDRFKHGYGLKPGIVDEAAALTPKPKYIITVDNGISSKEGVERARELGIEVLVTDHHLCPAPENMPKARLIVNPQQPDDSFPSKNIAGCGVAWYVAAALYKEMKDRKLQLLFRPEELLPYVALGTVADVVKLDRNNRILVSEGLKLIRQGRCPHGIMALAEVSKRELETLTCQDFGFALGPRINAAGRLAHMSTGIECLTTKDVARANTLAMQLHETNEERKALQKGIEVDAEALAASFVTHGDGKSIVAFEPDWHEGVIGIVAGRLKERFHLPVFILTEDHEGNIKGSGRAIEGFHLKHALDKVNIKDPSILIAFGGHAAAAGVTINKGKLEAFREQFDKACQEDLTPEILTPRLEHDGPLPHHAFNPQSIVRMNMDIWGQGFPQPLFMDSFKVASARTMGADESHLKVVLKTENDEVVDLVAFGDGRCINHLPNELQVAYTPGLNEWRGVISVQLMSKSLMNVDAPELEHQLTETSSPSKAFRKP